MGAFAKAEALLGPTLAFIPFLGVYPIFLLGSPESRVPMTLCPNLLGAGLAYRAGVLVVGVPMEGRATILGLRKGDSGRGSDGRDFLPCGLGALPSPTD